MNRFVLLLATLLCFAPGHDANADAYGGTAPAQPGDLGNSFINGYPARQIPATYKGKGDARNGPVLFSVNGGTNVYLAPTMAKTGTITCNGTTTLVFTPTLNAPGQFFPTYLLFATTGVRFFTRVTAAGAHCTSVFQQVNGIAAPSGGSQTITLGSAPTGTGTDSVELLMVPNTFISGTTTGSAANTHVFQISGSSCAISSSGDITGCPANTFSPERDQTILSSLSSVQVRSLKTYVHIHDDSGNCVGPTADGGFDAMMLVAPTTQTAELMPLPVPGSANSVPNVSTASPVGAFPMPCSIAAGNATISWGPLIFFGSDATTVQDNASTGRFIDIPFAGAADVAGYPNKSFVGQFATVADPFSAALKVTTTVASVNGSINNSTLTQAPASGQMTIGSDDTNPNDRMAQAIYNNKWRIAYFPPHWNSFEASATSTQLGYLQAVIRVGEGGVIWPESSPQYTFVGASLALGALPPPKTMSAASSFLNWQAKTGSNRIMVETGDSMMTDGTNGMGVMGSLGMEYYQAVNLKLGGSSTRYNYAIGGQTLPALDPNGPDLGNGIGIPSLACGARPAWYQGANCSVKWLTLIENLNPDDIPMNWAGNENQSFDLASAENVVQQTQSAAWRATTGRNPDLHWLPTYNNTNLFGFYGVGNDANGEYVTKAIRSLIDARAPQFPMAQGQSRWNIDVSRWRDIVDRGFDPQQEPTQRGSCNAPNAVGGQLLSLPLPYQLGCQVDGGWYIYVVGNSTGTVSAYTLWQNVGLGGLCYLVSNGAEGTPYVPGTQTGLQQGYPGGQFCWNVDNATGHYFVQDYIYNLSVTATLTVSNGGSSLTSATAIANHGYGLANIAISGAGACASALPAGETIAVGGVSSDGKTITLALPATGALTATSCTVQIYQLLFGPTDTGVTATVNQTNPTRQNIKFQVHGDWGTLQEVNPTAATAATDIWTGSLFGFGGFYYPTITGYAAGSYSGTLFTIPGEVKIDRPEAARLPQYLTAAEDWGPLNQIPGDNSVNGPFGGQAFAHESVLGALYVHQPLLDGMEWSVPVTASLTLPASGMTANALVGTLPPKATILYAIASETAGHNVTISLGTTSGATDVAASIALTASTSTNIPITSFAKAWFSNTASQSIFIDSAAWNSASVNITLYYVVGP